MKQADRCFSNQGSVEIGGLLIFETNLRAGIRPKKATKTMNDSSNIAMMMDLREIMVDQDRCQNRKRSQVFRKSPLSALMLEQIVLNIVVISWDQANLAVPFQSMARWNMREQRRDTVTKLPRPKDALR